ncbi:hypothetical protein [Paracidovorax wautersii]|uniref:Uncharacterized protein n=1 Tax=Paracidovorax wautersii TaxID=1177982 RepID=A0A1I2FIT0_9BURK|nr:hypothetical protein [Paracidovorax wautersii]SFF05175.1 hypothetical protein SAMN04489711_1118 [Paracidovorax wautersii]
MRSAPAGSASRPGQRRQARQVQQRLARAERLQAEALRQRLARRAVPVNDAEPLPRID